MSAFCKQCGNLLHARKLVEGAALYCMHCGSASTGSQPDQPSSLADDPDFKQKRLKPLLRDGRETKPIRSIARQLNIPENDLHEIFKQLDSNDNLPYGYYDKIERVYVRTNQDEDIDEDLLLDLIGKSYGHKVFHHQGLIAFIRAGRQTTSRKVLNSLHVLRKKKKIVGFKKDSRWLWRLLDPEAVLGAPTEDDSPSLEGVEGQNSSDLVEVRVPITSEDPPSGTVRSEPEVNGVVGRKSQSNEPDSSPTVFQIEGIIESTPKRAKKTGRGKEKIPEGDVDDVEENYSLAELARAASRSLENRSNDRGENDDDDDVQIIFADPEDDESD